MHCSFKGEFPAYILAMKTDLLGCAANEHLIGFYDPVGFVMLGGNMDPRAGEVIVTLRGKLSSRELAVKAAIYAQPCPLSSLKTLAIKKTMQITVRLGSNKQPLNESQCV